MNIDVHDHPVGPKTQISKYEKYMNDINENKVGDMLKHSKSVIKYGQMNDLQKYKEI